MSAAGSSVHDAVAGRVDDIAAARLDAALADWAGAAALERRLAETAAEATRELEARGFRLRSGMSAHEGQVLADAATVVRRAAYPAAKRLVEAADRAAAAGRSISAAEAAQVAEARAAAVEAGRRQRELPTPPPPRWRQKILWLVVGALVGGGAWSCAVTSVSVHQMRLHEDVVDAAYRAAVEDLNKQALAPKCVEGPPAP